MKSSLFFKQSLRKSFVIFTTIFLFSGLSYSSNRYFMCGPDEDGCYPEIYQYCACIPYNDLEANNPYCLDFDKMTCTPLSQTKSCDPFFTFKNQNECLATIFQSGPRPPCKVTTEAFCREHHTVFCDPTGYPKSCHH